jgi:hypothetical protein
MGRNITAASIKNFQFDICHFKYLLLSTIDPNLQKKFSIFNSPILNSSFGAPIWRTKIITMETSLQSGGTKSSRWKRPSNLEEQKNHGGNAPPIWRNKIIAVETFLQSGGTKSS